jgi:hypothetical protein
MNIALVVYLAAYVWTDDVVIADLNGAGVPGILTLYAVHRTCFMNLGILIGGALWTTLKKNMSENK